MTTIREGAPKLSEYQQMVKLCQDKYEWEIRKPTCTEVPELQDKYVFTGGIRRDFDRLRNYLLDTYVVRDSFGIDHSARRIFKNSMDGDDEKGKIMSWLAEHSKLRGNNIFVCIASMGFIQEDLKTKDLFKMPTDWLKDFSQLEVDGADYNKMSFENKIKFVNRLDKIILKLFTLLS